MTPALALIVIVPAVLAFAAFGMKYVFEYRLSERGLYFQLFRFIPVKVLPLRKIAAVERGPFGRDFWRFGMFTNVRLGNRLRGEAVLVKTRGLPITGVVVTPADPDAFERELHGLLEDRDRTGRRER